MTLRLTDKTFARLVMLGVIVGFLAVVGAGVGAGLMMLRAQENTGRVEHTYQVERTLDDLRLLIERSETARRGFLVEQDPQFRAIFEQSNSAMPAVVERLSALTRDNPRQQARVDRVRRALPIHRALLLRSMEAAPRGSGAMLFREDGSVQLTRALRGMLQQMILEEDQLLRARIASQREALFSFYLMLAAAGVLLVLVAFGTTSIILRYTRDLGASRNELRRLNENLEETVTERTSDLQRANDEIQRFAYIVSHDLRSPLVNVMGFTAELGTANQSVAAMVERVEREAPHLADPEALEAVRVELPEAIGFIRSSTEKMDRLINAILRLSREGRRAITPERIDMNALLSAVAGNLQHRTDQLGATVRIEPLPTIVSDRLALDQIFSNLVENALKYLKPGVPGDIVVRARPIGTRVVFEVADNGRGIDPRDHERVFDLFRRSGAQDQPGEGIGLAHVRALAYRLGGTIDCVSALGEGATFRVTLPVVFGGEREGNA